MLDRLVDLWALARPRAWRELQCSSFDRTGGNDDGFAGRFAPPAEAHERVLLDVAGAGCVHRIWSANPGRETRLAFLFDGEAEPRLECSFLDLFTGALPPFVEPLAAIVSGGAFSYVPLPFARSLRIVARGPISFYQITYGLAQDAAPITSFDAKRCAASPELARVCDRVRRNAPLPPPQPPAPLAALPRTRLAARQSATLELVGPAAVTRLAIAIEAPDPAYARRTTLRIFADRVPEPMVEAPLGDFFGSGYPGRAMHSLALDAEAGRFESRFVMPFATAMRIEIVNGDPDHAIDAQVAADGVRGSVAEFGGLRFHAGFRRELTEQGRPHPILVAAGRGQLVGCQVTMKSAGGLEYLEGDEQIVVDGTSDPPWNGTGTEDFFNAGWYFRDGPFLRAFHGLTHKDEARGEISAYRLLVSDAVPFTRTIDVELEHGGHNDAPDVEYSSVAYWYADAGGARPFARLEPSRIEPPRQVIAAGPGALPIARMEQSARTPLLPLEDLSRTQCGVRYLELAAGASERMLFRITIAGRYRARLLHAREPLGSMVDTIIDGTSWPPVSTAGLVLEPLARSELGCVSLAAGVHTLVLGAGRGQGRALIVGLELEPALPFVGSYEILGPFPLAGGRGFEDDQGPEHAEVLGWRAVTARADGYLDLRALVQPSDDAVVYARFFFEAAADQSITLRLGSDDFIAVFANRREVHRHAVHRAAAPDQDLVSMPVHAGRNEILLKVANQDGGFGVFARISAL
ncbi:MAG: glycoside hydrolase family 172 protein [Planctomycetota bacterium]